MANPRLPNITESEQELLYEKLNIYNQGKASYKEVGCYLVVLPREGHPNYSLWFYTPLLDRRCILFIEDLKPDIIQTCYRQFFSNCINYCQISRAFAFICCQTDF